MITCPNPTKKRIIIRKNGISKLAIGGVKMVSIDGNKIEMSITRRPPNLIDNHPPGTFGKDRRGLKYFW